MKESSKVFQLQERPFLTRNFSMNPHNVEDRIQIANYANLGVYLLYSRALEERPIYKFERQHRYLSIFATNTIQKYLSMVFFQELQFDDFSINNIPYILPVDENNENTRNIVLKTAENCKIHTEILLTYVQGNLNLDDVLNNIKHVYSPEDKKYHLICYVPSNLQSKENQNKEKSLNNGVDFYDAHELYLLGSYTIKYGIEDCSQILRRMSKELGLFCDVPTPNKEKIREEIYDIFES